MSNERLLPRILVTDAQDACNLSVIRCLGAAGRHVTATSLTKSGVGLWSRWCTSRVILPDPRISLNAFIDGVDRFLAREPHQAVIPGRDETLYALSIGREQLGSRLPVGLPSHEVVERSLSKAYLASAAAGAGLPVPDQRVCSDSAAAMEAALEFGWPLLVKPLDAAFSLQERVGRHPSQWVRDSETLREAQKDFGGCIVQRRVTGKVISVGGVATDRGLVGSVVSRYLRTWPAEGGRSSYTESIVPPAGLLDRVDALVAAIGWTGIFELELIQREDGLLHAIDFNPRPYGSMALARAAGVPLASLWCDALLGANPAPRSARAGVRFRFEQRDLGNLKLSVRGRNYGAAAAIMRPRRSTAHCVIEPTDPLPGLMLGAGMAGRVAEARLKRMIGAGRRPPPAG
jgi:predicted ATP-grasp superfamily ATP-dependent carboligase